jgi:hypothetical protein
MLRPRYQDPNQDEARGYLFQCEVAPMVAVDFGSARHLCNQKPGPCRVIMNEIYGASSNSNYSVGRNMCFVSNIADTRFPMTPMIRSIMRNVSNQNRRLSKKT